MSGRGRSATSKLASRAIDIEWDHEDVAFLHAECLADGTVRVCVYDNDSIDEVVL